MSELIGIAITRKIMGKMEEIESAHVSISSGIEGDARGKKRNRQITILFEDDWYDACKDVESDTGTFFFMDPPYRDSFTSYGEGFSDADQTKLIDFCKQRDQQGDTVFYCNRNGNDGFFEKHQGNLNMQLYDITYTAGRRKQEEDGGHSAKKAEEVLLHSDISLQTNTTFDILFEKV